MFVDMGGVSRESLSSIDSMDMECDADMVGAIDCACLFGAVFDVSVGVIGVSDGVGNRKPDIFGDDERLTW